MSEGHWLEQVAWADSDMTAEDELGAMVDGWVLLYGKEYLNKLAARLGGWAALGLALGELVEGVDWSEARGGAADQSTERS